MGWTVGHYIVGVLGVIASAVAASIKDSDTSWGRGFSITAAICISVVTFSNPRRTADLFWTAARLLNEARRRYELGLCDVAELNEAATRGEEVLTDWMAGARFRPPNESKSN